MHLADRRCVPDAFPLLTTARTQKFGASKAVWEEVAATVWARIPEPSHGTSVILVYYA